MCRAPAAVAAVAAAAAAAAAPPAAPAAPEIGHAAPVLTNASSAVCASDQDCAGTLSCVDGVCDCSQESGTDVVLDVLLPGLVVLLMYGMGCSIFVDDLRGHLRRPRPVFLGMLSQFGIMPVIAFSFGYWFDLPPEEHIAVVIIGCTPGGTTSNLFAYWANGDTSLSVAMTASSTLLAFGAQLSLIKLYTDMPGGLVDQTQGSVGSKVVIPYSKLLMMLVAVLLPVGAGVYTRYRTYYYSQWGERLGTWCGFGVVLIACTYGAITQAHLWRSRAEIWGVSVLMGLSGFVCGYALSTIFGANRRIARTVALETGIQNGPLAIAVIQLSFAGDKCLQSAMLTFPLFYSFWIVAESIFVALLLRQIPLDTRVLRRGQAQSWVVPGPGPEGGRPRRSMFTPKGAGLVNCDPARPLVRTLFDNFSESARLYPASRCLGTRRVTAGAAGAYEWQSYRSVMQQARRLGGKLRGQCGLGRGDFVGLYSRNRSEWVIAEQACNAFALTTVPLYDTLSPDATAFILNQTEMRVVVCSADRLAAVVHNLHGMGSVQWIICMDPVPADIQASPSKYPGAQLLEMADLVADSVKEAEPDPPAARDVAQICYTSGTTGNPKGAMLTHANMIAMATAAAGVGVSLSRDDVYISYLPLAHVFERNMHVALLGAGAAIGFFRGDVAGLLDDTVTLHPTVFCSVPRLLNKMYDSILMKVEQQNGWTCCVPRNFFPPLWAKKALFKKGYRAKIGLIEERNLFEDGFWDSTVFSALQRVLGGRVRYIITGSAPIRAEVLSFLRVVFSCNVHEGYGQTECACAATLTLPGDCSTGHVGPPLPACEVKLVSVPEMGYTVVDQDGPRGEVCIRGPTVFRGYYKNEARTKEAFPEGDDWLHTGDIGKWLPDGTLRIIDRKKAIFKLSQGEYISPELCEAVYMRSALIMQAWVYGDPLQHHVVAVVVPDRAALLMWAAQSHPQFTTAAPEPADADESSSATGSSGSIDARSSLRADRRRKEQRRYLELCRSPAVRAKLLQDIATAAATCHLRPFEIARSVWVEPEEWTAEGELLTPTFKIRRAVMKVHYQKQIDDMYGTTLQREMSRDLAEVVNPKAMAAAECPLKAPRTPLRGGSTVTRPGRGSAGGLIDRVLVGKEKSGALRMGIAGSSASLRGQQNAPALTSQDSGISTVIAHNNNRSRPPREHVHKSPSLCDDSPTEDQGSPVAVAILHIQR